ncbi:MAG: GNAT family N-acetyltransferase [Candidatus Hodarchaeales archaeon]|jgi:GNAT superfamily N-acetyltransferase
MNKTTPSSVIIRTQETGSNMRPVKHVFHLSGWIVRISEGITKRANSVLPNFYSGEKISEDIEKVEQFYQAFSLPVIFQMADHVAPKNLDEHLKTAGYEKESKTNVLGLLLSEMKTKLPDNKYQITYTSKLTEEWITAKQTFLQESNETMQGKKAIIERILLAKPYLFSLRHQNEIRGVALGVSLQSELGIFEIVVDPNHQRKHFGTNLMQYIFDFAKTKQIKSIFLQVEKKNTPAMNLYTKLGFKKLYSYYYRIKK